MKNILIIAILFLAFLLTSPFAVLSQPTTGGKPKYVVNQPVKEGTPSKRAKKTQNVNKKSVLSRSRGLYSFEPPPGAREKRQNKTQNKRKKYIRM